MTSLCRMFAKGTPGPTRSALPDLAGKLDQLLNRAPIAKRRGRLELRVEIGVRDLRLADAVREMEIDVTSDDRDLVGRRSLRIERGDEARGGLVGEERDVELFGLPL